jgi:hypothetical protein
VTTRIWSTRIGRHACVLTAAATGAIVRRVRKVARNQSRDIHVVRASRRESRHDEERRAKQLTSTKPRRGGITGRPNCRSSVRSFVTVQRQRCCLRLREDKRHSSPDNIGREIARVAVGSRRSCDLRARTSSPSVTRAQLTLREHTRRRDTSPRAWPQRFAPREPRWKFRIKELLLDPGSASSHVDRVRIRVSEWLPNNQTHCRQSASLAWARRCALRAPCRSCSSTWK